jgi:outer membrane murein-binding lipoprotein Lpp
MTRALWVPWAVQDKSIPLRDSQQRTIVPVGLVRHTAVSNATVVRPTGTVRWHFYLNRTGTLYQFFPVNRPASCQLDGNYWTESGAGRGFLSCESWDGAGVVWDGRNVNRLPPWNEAQLATWSRLDVWLHTEWDVPLVKASGPRGRGFGWHAQFTTRSGSDEPTWNHSHACPAPARISQCDDILARSVSLVRAVTTPPTEDDMTPEQATTLGRIATDVAKNQARYDDLQAKISKTTDRIQANVDETDRKTQEAVKFVDDKVDRVVESLQGLYAKIDGLSAKVDALGDDEPETA